MSFFQKLNSSSSESAFEKLTVIKRSLITNVWVQRAILLVLEIEYSLIERGDLSYRDTGGTVVHWMYFNGKRSESEWHSQIPTHAPINRRLDLIADIVHVWVYRKRHMYTHIGSTDTNHCTRHTHKQAYENTNNHTHAQSTNTYTP